MTELDDLKRTLAERTERELRHVAEIEQLRKFIEIQKATNDYCVCTFCGERFRKDDPKLAQKTADHMMACASHPMQKVAEENIGLRLLLIRKSEALAVFASPAMWSSCTPFVTGQTKVWNGVNEYSDPMAFAKREAEATEPSNGP